MGLDTGQLKELQEGINTKWSEMKHVIEESTAEVKSSGEKHAETKQTLDRIEAAMKQQEDEIKQLRAEAQRPRFDGGDAEHKSRYRNEDHQRVSGIFWSAMRSGWANLDDPERKELNRTFSAKSILGDDPDERKMNVLFAPERKALSVGDETTGGYLAPPEFVQDIIKGVQLISPVRPMAQVRTTSRRSVQYPVRSGVFAAKWTAETGTRAETAGLTYALEEIPTHEMYADVLVSDQDLEDAVFNLEQEILDNCTEQFAKAEGAAFVNGSASGQPEGILTNANVASDAYTMASSGANAHTLGPSMFITTWANLKTVYAKQATWLLNRQAIGQARGLVDGQGRFLWEPGLADGTPPNLLGSPYIEVPDMPNVPTGAGAAACVAYGNVKRAYLIVDRISVVVRRLQEKYAESGQIAYLVRKRVGGQVVLPEAIRKMTVTFA